MKILLIDNYDSFTFNLFHYLSSLKANVEVIRNDKITSKEILKKKYDKIVISPGPGRFFNIPVFLDIILLVFPCINFLAWIIFEPKTWPIIWCPKQTPNIGIFL